MYQKLLITISFGIRILILVISVAKKAIKLKTSSQVLGKDKFFGLIGSQKGDEIAVFV